MKIGFVTALLTFVILITACRSEEAPQESPVSEDLTSVNHSFFVAGHVYGKAIWGDMVAEPGLHPPFVAKFEEINRRTTIEHGFLTGDVVQTAEELFWQKCTEQLNELAIPIYTAPGNHDVNGPNPLVKDEGELYEALYHKDDLYLILNTNNPAWMIDSVQLNFIEQTLNDHPETKNIFVFAHHLLFWEKDGRFGAFEPNWFNDKPSQTNFASDVLPLFEGKGDHVYFFFGDVGARDGMQIFYSNEGHHSYIASGMGGYERDNFLIVNIADDNSVEIEIVYLNDVGKNVSTKLQVYEWPD